jgi:hypothetical protein
MELKRLMDLDGVVRRKREVAKTSIHGDQFYWWKKLEYPERTPTMGTQLVNFITCGCVSIAPF